MFRHVQAPMCTKLNRCGINLCQFRHRNEEESENQENASEDKIADTEFEANCIIDDIECEDCIINIGESVNHKNDNIQECSQCDYETKCESAFNEHWASSPDHIFPREKLKTFTYA